MSEKETSQSPKQKRGISNWIKIWIVLSAIIVLGPLVYLGISFFGAGGVQEEGALIMFLCFFLPLILVPSLLLVGIIGAVMYTVAHERQTKRDWQTAVETLAPADFQLPLCVKVTYPQQLSRAFGHVPTIVPRYAGRGTVTIADDELVLEGPPLTGTSLSGLLGAVGGGLLGYSLMRLLGPSLTRKTKSVVPISSITKVQLAIPKRAMWPSASILLYHLKSGVCVCAFTLADVSDFDKFWTALGSRLPQSKLILP